MPLAYRQVWRLQYRRSSFRWRYPGTPLQPCRTFYEAGYFLAVMAPGILKGIADDLLAAGAADQLEALHHVVGLAILDAGIEVFFVLTDDDHVHVRMFRIDKRVIGYARTHIGIETKHGARCDVEALIAATLGCSDGCFEKYPGAAQRFPCARLDTCVVAAQIDLLANFDLFNLYTRPCLLDDVEGSIHDFWANAITVSHCYRRILCHSDTSIIICSAIYFGLLQFSTMTTALTSS